MKSGPLEILAGLLLQFESGFVLKNGFVMFEKLLMSFAFRCKRLSILPLGDAKPFQLRHYQTKERDYNCRSKIESNTVFPLPSTTRVL